MAALEGFIEDPEVWFNFLQKRNLTVHAHQEAEMEKVLLVCPLFSQEVKKFLQKIVRDRVRVPT